ncbi:MAG: glycosyltransferase family 39 protein, partial [Chrysiogenales bacterium]
LLGGELVPLHSRMLGIYGGLALTMVCGFALWYRYLCRRPDFAFLKTGRGKFLFVILVVLALLTLSISVNRAFSEDEVEHIHASWYVQNGQVPYRDFFEQHHPLFWFLLAPLIAICGEGLLVLAIFRLLILLMAAGIAWLTWRISRLAGGNAETAWLAVVILFANFLFIPCVMEIRPDIPMVLLALAAVERLLVFMKEEKPKQLLAASFLATLSFLFLQKVIFLFPAAAVLLCIWRLQGKISSTLFWETAAVFLLPLFLFAAWLFFSGSFRDYFLCNWLLNVKRQGVFSLWLVIGRMALVNIVFWLSLLPALAHALRSEKSPAAMKVVAWFSFTALAALFLLPNPADRHFLLSLPLLSVIVGVWAGDRSHFPFRGRLHKIYLAGLLVVPLPFLSTLGFPLNGVQLEKFAYVLRQTTPDEKVLDGRNDFNLFRPDAHYFWFQLGPGEMLDNYRRIVGGRHSAYDVCRMIREQKPSLILLDSRELNACDLWREYMPTPYPGLLFRAKTAITADGK